MRKEDKATVIEQITATLKEYSHIYLTETTTLNAEKTSNLRRECFKNDIKPLVVKNSLLKKAMEIMEQHLDDVEFSTEEFAREMCMSRSSLHLKMKALTGESTNDFIRKIRFNRACKLLKEGRYTVAEISVMVGFSTPSYFATSFKKYFGCLPSEYIKNK